MNEIDFKFNKIVIFFLPIENVRIPNMLFDNLKCLMCGL